MATLEEQIELEYQMVQSGVDRYNKQLNDLLEKDLGSKTNHGRTIITGIVEPVQEALTAYINDSGRYTNRSRSKTLLKGMAHDKVAYLALICVIDNLANYGTLLKVARNVGMQIETQKRLDTWLELDKANMSGTFLSVPDREEMKGCTACLWPDSKCFDRCR